MTVSAVPTVLAGWSSYDWIDLTDRIVSLSNTLDTPLAQMGTAGLTVRLRNNDGALTPDGGGTYASTDWFSLPLRLAWTVTGDATYDVTGFDGMITGFDLIDDGQQSTVVLTAIDSWRIAGRFKNPLGISSFSSTTPVAAINTVLSSAYFPGTGSGSMGDYGNVNALTVRSDTTLSSMSAIDFISNVILPAVRGYAWPTTISTDTFNYVYGALACSGTKTVSLATHSFTSTPATSGDIPFASITQGWTNDRLINSAAIKSLRTSAVGQSDSDTTSLYKYGPRQVNFTQAACATDGAAALMCHEYVASYANARFVPITVTFGSSQLAVSSTVLSANVAQLLSINAPLDRVDIAWTPTQASATTATGIVVGRRVDYNYATGFTLTLNLASWTDTTLWIIGVSRLGQDRLG